jgi:hypothetical protein
MKLYIAREGQVPEADDDRWWTTPYGRWRLAAETTAMAERFPGFVAELSQTGELTWRGSLRSALDGGGLYRVAVTYPDDFPDSPPRVELLAPRLPEGTPHVLSDRRLCLFRDHGTRSGYEPARTTAATLVAWTALWIHAFETWRATGTWPGNGA